jgi:hypothetical protein
MRKRNKQSNVNPEDRDCDAPDNNRAEPVVQPALINHASPKKATGEQNRPVPIWMFYAGAAALLIIFVAILIILHRPPHVATVRYPWLDIDPPLPNAPGQRDPHTYDEVIHQFAVESNPRYRKDQQGEGETYCNIFVWDVTKAMGAEIPHWVDDYGNPSAQFEGSELSANGLIAWLENYGGKYGWKVLEARQAQAEANLGKPVVATWKNPDGVGHVAMVRPGEYSTTQGPALANAGAINSNHTTVKEVFGNKEVMYYYHD